MEVLQIEGLPAPHGGQPIYYTGASFGDAEAAFVMIHGRGASARHILSLAAEFPDSRFIYLAPHAANATWYPYRFLAPIESNEPYLSSALATVAGVVQKAVDSGIAQEKIYLLGFSQGACLAQEYAIRNAGRYGGVVGLSGGLIGPPGTEWNFPGDLAGTPVFLGCSDVDAHIPLERVEESALVFARMGANVTKRIYPGMGHTINEDELEFVRSLIAV